MRFTVWSSISYLLVFSFYLSAVNAERTQTKTFTRWINGVLRAAAAAGSDGGDRGRSAAGASREPVRDLGVDLSDGSCLVELLDALTTGQASVELVSLIYLTDLFISLFTCMSLPP